MSEQDLDRLALVYLDALDRGDFATVDHLWDDADQDPDLAAMLQALDVAELAALKAADEEQIKATVTDAVREHLPTATVEASPEGPLTLAMVAAELAREPGTADAFNQSLLANHRVVPDVGSLPKLLAWAQAEFGDVPEAYWRSFRAAAQRLKAAREDAQYGLAARAAKRRPQ